MIGRMPMPRKPDPVKFCAYCGTQLARKRQRNGSLESLLHFGRRKFCDRACMAADFDARPVTLTPTYSTAHWHSRKEIPPGSCAWCGKPAGSDVHHLSGDWTDNSLENLARICRSCHLKAHKQSRTCIICGKPHKGLGYCELHYQRLKKTGDPEKVLTPTRKRCSVCDEPAHARLLCGKHYMQAKRAGSLPPV